MSESINLATITISIHVHSTENLNKVMGIFSYFLPISPEEIKDKVNMVNLTGDYGNDIIILTYRIKFKKEIKHFVQILSDCVPLSHKQYLYRNFQPSNVFFLRFNKQLLSRGIFRLSQYDDVVHVSLKFSSFTKKNEKTNIQDYLLNTGIIAV
ncbi:MAG: RNA-binding domain-containing protein [Candidatus Hodarchaeota archaeon]